MDNQNSCLSVPNEPVTSKRQMYRLLTEGAFGNTIPQFFSYESWVNSLEYSRYRIWGIRSLRAGGGPCRLNCPREEVLDTISRSEFASAGVNISAMMDVVTRVKLWCEVVETETGLAVYGIENPPRDGSWRELMGKHGVQYTGLTARNLLRRSLNGSSLADLRELLDKYPGHVVELSACSSNVGTIPGRNAIIWEVRKY